MASAGGGTKESPLLISKVSLLRRTLAWLANWIGLALVALRDPSNVGVFVGVFSDEFRRAIGGSAVDNEVFRVAALLVDHIPDAELNETNSIKDGCDDG